MLTQNPNSSRHATRIMLCEDDPMIADMFAMMLEGAGYTVVGQSATGTHALNVTEEENPHVALVDLGLRGEVDGITLVGWLRERNVRPIVVTGNHQRLQVAVSAGAEAVLLKPVPFKELLDAVNRARDAGGPLRPWTD